MKSKNKAKKSTKKTASKKSVKKSDNRTVPSLKSNILRTKKIVSVNKKAVFKLTGIYALLYFLFVRSITQIDLGELRELFTLLYGENGQETLNSRVNLAGNLFSESTNFDQASGFYFATIFVICSLALIWLMRHFWSKNKTTVKMAFYQGMYPIVPFMLILMLMLVQAIPMSITSYIMQTSFQNGIAVTFIEKIGIVSIFALGVTISAYWIAGSIIAAYAVTVPGVYPLQALRRAKEILKGRRFLVVRQIVAFLVLSGLACLAAMLGVIYFIPDASIVAVTILVVLIMPWMHFYFYGLYRDLINE